MQEDDISNNKKFNWILFIVFMAITVITIQILYYIFLQNYVSGLDRQGQFGDMFGALTALFSGLAFVGMITAVVLQTKELGFQREELALTRQELVGSRNAQEDIAKHQRNAISLQVILPLMDEVGGDQMRKAIIKISDFKRLNGGENKFDKIYKELLGKRRTGKLTENERVELEEVDSARRRFSMIFHKMYRLRKSKVVNDEIVKLVIGPDSAHLFLNVVKRLEVAISDNYNRDLFDFSRQLYTEKELIEKGAY